MPRHDYSGIRGVDPRITAQVKSVNGSPRLFIDGAETDPFMFFGNTEHGAWQNTLDKEIKLAAAQSIHLHSIVTHMEYADALEFRFDHLREAIDYTIAADPQALLFLRISVPSQPIEWWENQPDGLFRYASGVRRHANYHQDEWVRSGAQAILRLIEFIRSVEEYDKRVIGYHLFPPVLGEWMVPEAHTMGVDFSEAGKARFNEFLREKYRTDEALSAAWKRSVRLGQADIPTPPCNQNFGPEGLESPRLFLDIANQQDVLDLYAYINDFNFQMLDELSEVVKRATNGKSLVMNFYGYLFELGDVKTGHMAIRRALKSPWVDIFCSPTGYLDRLEGGIMSYMSPVDSIQAAGKMWFIEDDTKTCLAPDDGADEYDPFNRKISDLRNTCMVHARDMATAICRGSGIWWMDLWAHGWLDSPEMWANIRSLCDIYAEYGRRFSFRHQPDVAFVGDEDGIKALFNPWHVGKALLQQSIPAFYHSGLSFGQYLLEDVLDGGAPDCRLYVIAGAYAMDEEKARRILQRFAGSGKTVLWVYGADTAGGRYTKMLTGFDLHPVADSPRPAVVDLPADHPYVYARPVSPLYTADTAGAEHLASFADSSDCAYAAKVWNGYTSLWYGGLTLTAQALRLAARYAGVPVYAEDNDVYAISNHMVAVYARTAGEKILRFPRQCRVLDEHFSSIAEHVDHIRVNMEQFENRFFFFE